LDERRERACQELRETRDRAYEAILEQQRFDRGELAVRQHQGLRNYQLMDMIHPAPEPARPAQAKATWRVSESNPSERVSRQNAFDLSGRAATDPRQCNQLQNVPGVVQRGNESATPVQATDGFGRALREGREALDQKRQAKAEISPVPDTQVREVTDAGSERARSQKAREMTDQAAAKAGAGEAAALRASWNKRRRSRD
jgi:hypothetical protein